ncbi:MAG TPA: ferredoxin family protein, partial [Chthoniobacteraceae bacterium]
MPLAPALRVVLYEGTGGAALAADERYATLTGLLERGFAVTSASGERAVAPSDSARTVVLGRFGGNPPEVAGAQTRDISGLGVAQIGDLVETARAQLNAPAHGTWKPWFPV